MPRTRQTRLSPLLLLLLSAGFALAARDTDAAAEDSSAQATYAMAGGYTVGVADLESEGYPAAALAATARSLMEESLRAVGHFTLVERSRLADLLDEVAFEQSGVTRRQGAAEPGLGLNVQVLVFGSVARQRGGDVHVTFRSVEVATGKVLHTETVLTVASEPSFSGAVRRAARRLAFLTLGHLPRQSPAPIPAAALEMGSATYPEEGPVHTVQIGAFLMDRTEVSNAEFYAYQQSQERRAARSGDALPGLPDMPATGMSWQEASGFCGWVGKRLPTEAEWELAARGAEGRLYPWGEAPPSPRHAVFAASGPIEVESATGGSTPEGILHLAGNVAEWVADWYDPRYYAGSPAQDPRGPATGDYRVVRGGSYASGADELRGAARGFHNPERGAPHIGFRCVESTAAAP